MACNGNFRFAPLCGASYNDSVYRYRPPGPGPGPGPVPVQSLRHVAHVESACFRLPPASELLPWPCVTFFFDLGSSGPRYFRPQPPDLPTYMYLGLARGLRPVRPTYLPRPPARSALTYLYQPTYLPTQPATWHLIIEITRDRLRHRPSSRPPSDSPSNFGSSTVFRSS